MAFLGERLERRVERAVRFVGDYWLPVNPDLVQSIRSDLDRSAPLGNIVQSIQKDFSLFFFCIRKLQEMLGEDGEDRNASQNPVEMLYAAGVERLTSILNSDIQGMSSHILHDASELQMSRFHETLLSSRAAEVLSEEYGVSQEEAYSAAVLRQLGLTLIAWNYQELYREVATTLEPGEQLEVKLADRLGYSPNLLAIRVLGSWGISESACAALGLLSEYDQDSVLRDAMNDALGELCEVGEALARAHHPEVYPTAREDWDFAKQEIVHRLGKYGMQQIHERITQSQDVYALFMPHIFHAGLFEAYLPAEGRILPEFHENPFLPHCAPKTARAIQQLYDEIENGATGVQNVRIFGKQTITAAGFQGGSIYVADPGLMMLMPKYTFGEVVLEEPRAQDYSLVLSQGHMTSLAYQGIEPIVQYRKAESGEVISAIAGMFGRSQRVGVLYLEIPGMISELPNDEPMIHFQALRHVLNDCLRLT